ncbi:MAG: hypothetical protein Q4B26_18770 [Eubacteriales bacterium]|nr:hypothetical protein [Eubacteriales bacterium]
MVTKNRITLIRLAEKLSKNDGYAKRIGVKVALKKNDDQRDTYSMRGESVWIQQKSAR